MNDILKNISNSDVYKEISEELGKQYNTIKLEQQDVLTYDSLREEKERKLAIVEDINNENNSDEFNEVLGEFLENEKKYREALYLEQQKKEYAERQKKLLRDKEIQEERNRRQKLIEEERNKDIEKRTKELLKEKQNSVLDVSKTKEMPTRSVKDINVTSGKSSKLVKDDDTFFSNREMQELNSNIDQEKESSWF